VKVSDILESSSAECGHLFPDSMLDLADKLDAYALEESTKLEKKTA
jgi:hypothetical protein